MKRKRPTRFGARLQQARKDAGLSQERLGELLDVAERTIRHYEAGSKEPGLHRLPQIAALTGKSLGWFFDEPEFRSILRVPLYDEVPAGPPRPPAQDVQATIPLPDEWLAGESEVYCLRVRGRSMEPVLVDGDIIAVRRQPDAEHGDAVVATVAGGEFVVKRLSKNPPRVTLTSLNRNYPSIDADESVRIEGRVIGLLREL